MKENSTDMMRKQLEEIADLCCEECRTEIMEKTRALDKKYPNLDNAGPIKQFKAGKEAMKIGKGVCKQCKRKIRKHYK